jgi:GTP cyclohydrolase III
MSILDKLFNSKVENKDPLEVRLDKILDITRGLGRKEINALIEAIKGSYEIRQNLKKVQTDDEKEMADIDEAERILTRESK